VEIFVNVLLKPPEAPFRKTADPDLGKLETGNMHDQRAGDTFAERGIVPGLAFEEYPGELFRQRVTQKEIAGVAQRLTW
jgi:hypothetical protein